MAIPIEARVKNPSQSSCERGTDDKPTAPKRHIERKFLILFITLRATPDVVPLVVVIFRQDSHQILSEKKGIIVAENVPINAGIIEGNSVFDDAGDAVTWGEGRGVGWDDDGRERGGGVGWGAV